MDQADKSAFVAVYGRRRVGKTYLVRHVFEEKFTFHLTGIANVGLQPQLANFYAALVRYFPWLEDKPMPVDWFQAFQYLISALERSQDVRKVLFLDELPWFDYPRSGFIPALEHFWNSFASARRDILLLVCGSAASWMINNLINNRGGLHNRVTHRIRLDPFTLNECEAFLQQKSFTYDRYQIVQLYMALGGIPFYLEAVSPEKSAAQNINDLCFSPRGMLRKEFDSLLASLFKNAGKHIAIIEVLAKKAKGLERGELLKLAKLTDGGSASKILGELEESSFIKKYPAFGKSNRYVLYQLVDFYSLFYLKFIKNSSELDKDFWLNSLDNPEVRAWSGYSFEQVCLAHLDKIKQALGISGIQTRSSAWVGESGGQKAQIDLVIDRRDHVINLCEMKFSLNPFEINKSYADDLRTKIGVFKSATQTKKAVFLTLITTFGIQAGGHAGGLVQNSLTVDVLF
ncbi:MAG: ATPase [Saprospiraceae bacterium]|nr:ATPase [Saprospiraceae bacterium]